MENENTSEEYVSGFNQGYNLAKHAPDFANKLNKVGNNSDRMLGMKEGIEQYNLEQTKNPVPDWLKKDRLSSLDKSENQSKEKDRED